MNMAIDGVGAGNYQSNYAQDISVKTISNDSQPRADISLSKSKEDSQYGRDNQDRGNVIKDKEVSPEKVKAAVDDLNKKVKMKHTQCSFKYHDDTNRISITVMDSETQEVIKEIPPEKALDMLAKAWELAGLMVDEKR